MPNSEYWVVGKLLDPQPEDLLSPIDDELQAINRASDRSFSSQNDVIAVWDNRDNIEWIFINGDQYRKL